ncbi:MAG: CDP-diacylglycerol--serine O-phosphatidyltransferase [Candidatus Schekmanbacteria bacterium]|nr:CDP-diacylglycerol--serine O-phosphatidyltransferase [Candidatus Schekmanbacteria bacterium]
MTPSETLANQRADRMRRIRRGAFILPSLFTVGNIFFGFFAIVLCLRHYAGNPVLMRPGTSKAMHFIGVAESHLELAAVFILIAAMLDLLDGRIARLTNTLSDFGAELDSLADVVSFGIAPGLLAFSYGLSSYDRGWVPAFLFLVCGAVRLARFNTQTHHGSPRFFVGLPIPAAALYVVSVVLAVPPVQTAESSFIRAAATTGIVVVLSFLMVSTIRYRSFKDIDFRSTRSSRMAVLFAAFVTVTVATDWRWVMLVGLTGYIVSGPVARMVPFDLDEVIGKPIARFLVSDNEDVETDDREEQCQEETTSDPSS